MLATQMHVQTCSLVALFKPTYVIRISFILFSMFSELEHFALRIRRKFAYASINRISFASHYSMARCCLLGDAYMPIYCIGLTQKSQLKYHFNCPKLLGRIDPIIRRAYTFMHLLRFTMKC